MKIIRDIEQGSDDWINLRLGIITASGFKNVLAGGAGKTRKSYMYKLASEILTGAPVETFKNDSMVWGNVNEPAARSMYEIESGNEVNEVAFIKNHYDYVGASPDGMIGENGLLEIKCPNTTTQIETFLSGKMPPCHKAQVQGQLWITDAEWCDFVSFDPRIDGDAMYCCYRQQRDEEYIKNLEIECIKFNQELTEIIKKLRG